jgi:hypothetical protein
MAFRLPAAAAVADVKPPNKNAQTSNERFKSIRVFFNQEHFCLPGVLSSDKMMRSIWNFGAANL